MGWPGVAYIKATGNIIPRYFQLKYLTRDNDIQQPVELLDH